MGAQRRPVRAVIGAETKRRNGTSSRSLIEASKSELRGDLVRRFDLDIYQGKRPLSRNGVDASIAASSDEVAMRRGGRGTPRHTLPDQDPRTTNRKARQT